MDCTGKSENIDMTFMDDGRLLAVGSKTGDVFIFETATGKPIQKIMHKSEVNSVAYSKKHHKIISAAVDKTIKLTPVLSDGRVNCIR